MVMPNQNILSSFLEDNPYSVYYNQLMSMDPRRRQYFQPRYGDVYGQFQGAQAGQALAGQQPTGKFSDFLSQYNFGEEYGRLAPWQRGEYNSRYAPPARWLTGY